VAEQFQPADPRHCGWHNAPGLHRRRRNVTPGEPARASPSALTPAGRWQVIAALARIAVSGEVAPRQKAAPTAEAAAS
jgi:hypothetical protein